jgi:Flp pilus assembly pilin Flp
VLSHLTAFARFATNIPPGASGLGRKSVGNMEAGRVRKRLSGLRVVLSRFKQNEDGSALTAYTVLLGLLLTVVLMVIAIIGAWIDSEWAAMNTHS